MVVYTEENTKCLLDTRVTNPFPMSVLVQLYLIVFVVVKSVGLVQKAVFDFFGAFIKFIRV